MARMTRGPALTLAASLLGVLAVAGCVQGHEPVVSELRDVHPFTRLEVGTSSGASVADVAEH